MSRDRKPEEDSQYWGAVQWEEQAERNQARAEAEATKNAARPYRASWVVFSALSVLGPDMQEALLSELERPGFEEDFLFELRWNRRENREAHLRRLDAQRRYGLALPQRSP